MLLRDFWSLSNSSVSKGCLSGTTGGGLETFDSLDLIKDKIVESTCLFGYCSLEKVSFLFTFILKKVLVETAIFYEFSNWQKMEIWRPMAES